ncbi:MAG: hypothetical protein QW271_07480 [Sulfolobales archaeon]
MFSSSFSGSSESMRELRDSSIRLVVTSLPYYNDPHDPEVSPATVNT